MVLNHFSCFFFSFVCRPPLCVRAGPRVHGHAARMCEDKSERARAREQLRDHLHVRVAALTFPPLFTPNHIIIRSLTLETNISADLWQTSHHPHHHFRPCPPPKHATTSTSFPFLGFPVQSQGGDILGVTMCLFCGVFTVPQSTDDLS